MLDSEPREKKLFIITEIDTVVLLVNHSLFREFYKKLQLICIYNKMLFSLNS
jgi:hypothetical protein